MRGFRLGLTTVISTAGLAAVSDRTSPLPGLGTWFRYKLLTDAEDAESLRPQIQSALAAPGWTIRTAREGLGQMVRYYDMFMRFLLIVGLGSLLIGGVAVWAGMQAYIAERATIIAVLRSIGASRARVFLHFLAQVAALATTGVVIGLLLGGGAAYLVLPMVSDAVGISLGARLHPVPLLVAAGAGMLTALAFSYLPLQQAQAIRPVLLFRSVGLAAAAIDWRSLLASPRALPLAIAALGFFWLAYLMTGDAALVAAFALASAAAAVILQLFARAVKALLGRLRLPSAPMLRHALRAIAGSGSNARPIIVSTGMAFVMLVVVLVLQGNLRQEFLGASAFDVPTLVASDLFPDELEQLESMAHPENGIARVFATPMLRGTLTRINGVPVAAVGTRGPEAGFLLAGEVPLTYRSSLPSTSKLVAGSWWPADYRGPGLVSLHRSLRSGFGVEIGDTLTFEIFGEETTVTVASFREYSWQGGIDFLATFSPGVLDAYPTTLFAAVTALPGQEQRVERDLAATMPDLRFIAIGETLQQITTALSQLSLAAALVGGLAVGNGLLVLIGSLAAGLRQRQADAVITKVLGATRPRLLATAFLQYLILAVLAIVPATAIGVTLGWVVSMMLMEVEFSLSGDTLGWVLAAAVIVTGILGATTILRSVTVPPARLLREP